MKKDIHPKNYRLVVFKDMSNDHAFMSRSTINTKDTIVWEDGNEYPLVKLEISPTMHTLQSTSEESISVLTYSLSCETVIAKGVFILYLPFMCFFVS